MILNVVLFSYVIYQNSEFLVAGDFLLVLVTKYWFKQSKMAQYKEKIVVPYINMLLYPYSKQCLSWGSPSLT